jgi:hypothetical protein
VSQTGLPRGILKLLPRQNFQINRGITALAKELGCSPSLVSKRLKKGESMDQMRVSVKAKGIGKGGRRGKGTRTALIEAKQKQAESVGKVYVPPRSGRKAQLLTRTVDQTVGLVGRLVDPMPAQPLVLSSSMYEAPTVPAEFELEAKTRLTVAQANEREIIVAQKAGQLVTIVAVNNWFGTVIIKIRDRLLRLSGELAEGLAAEENPAAVEQLLKTEIIRVLDMAKLMGREGEAVDVA